MRDALRGSPLLSGDGASGSGAAAQLRAQRGHSLRPWSWQGGSQRFGRPRRAQLPPRATRCVYLPLCERHGGRLFGASCKVAPPPHPFRTVAGTAVLLARSCENFLHGCDSEPSQDPVRPLFHAQIQSATAQRADPARAVAGPQILHAYFGILPAPSLPPCTRRDRPLIRGSPSIIPHTAGGSPHQPSLSSHARVTAP